MALFKKKKKKDDPTSHEASRDKEEKLVKKRRQRKKEPPKPWGKKERILVFVVLFLTLGTSATLALSARNWKLPGLPRINFGSSSFSFLKNETITLEGDRDEVRDIVVSNEVVLKFREMTNELSGMYGLYVVDLDNNFSYGVGETEVFQAASLIKLPVMVGMYLSAESGEMNLDDKYELKSEDKIAGAGSLYSKPEGYEITYRGLVELMGQQSDNTAYNIAKNALGARKISEIINYVGMPDTDFASNMTTPKDIGTFFQKLYVGSLINEENKNELLGFLTDTIYEQWLAAGVPSGVRVAHKYGREVHVVNDAGIVFSDDPSGSETALGRRPFVIVLMSDGVVEREADKIFPELARMVYELEVE